MSNDYETDAPTATSLQDANLTDILARADAAAQRASDCEDFHLAFGQLPFALLKRFDELANSDPIARVAWGKVMQHWHRIDGKRNS